LLEKLCLDAPEVRLAHSRHFGAELRTVDEPVRLGIASHHRGRKNAIHGAHGTWARGLRLQGMQTETTMKLFTLALGVSLALVAGCNRNTTTPPSPKTDTSSVVPQAA